MAYAPVTIGKDCREFFDSVLDALSSVSSIDLHRTLSLATSIILIINLTCEPKHPLDGHHI